MMVSYDAVHDIVSLSQIDGTWADCLENSVVHCGHVNRGVKMSVMTRCSCWEHRRFGGGEGAGMYLAAAAAAASAPAVRVQAIKRSQCSDAGTGALHIAVVNDDVTKCLCRV